jgi:hypothetical protein
MNFLQPATPKHEKMHPWEPPLSLNVTVTMAVSMGVVTAQGMLDIVDIVHTVDAVKPETATNVIAPIAHLPSLVLLHAQRRSALTQEEVTQEIQNSFASSAGL